VHQRENSTRGREKPANLLCRLAACKTESGQVSTGVFKASSRLEDLLLRHTFLTEPFLFTSEGCHNVSIDAQVLISIVRGQHCVLPQRAKAAKLFGIPPPGEVGRRENTLYVQASISFAVIPTSINHIQPPLVYFIFIIYLKKGGEEGGPCPKRIKIKTTNKQTKCKCERRGNHTSS